MTSKFSQGIAPIEVQLGARWVESASLFVAPHGLLQLSLGFERGAEVAPALRESRDGSPAPGGSSWSPVRCGPQLAARCRGRSEVRRAPVRVRRRIGSIFRLRRESPFVHEACRAGTTLRRRVGRWRRFFSSIGLASSNRLALRRASARCFLPWVNGLREVMESSVAG